METKEQEEYQKEFKVDCALLEAFSNFAEKTNQEEMDEKIKNLISELDDDEKNEIINSLMSVVFSCQNEKIPG